jgi:hypothetical protein
VEGIIEMDIKNKESVCELDLYESGCVQMLGSTNRGNVSSSRRLFQLFKTVLLHTVRQLISLVTIMLSAMFE